MSYDIRKEVRKYPTKKLRGLRVVQLIIFSGYFPMLQEFHCQNTSANAGCPKLLLNYKGQIKKFWMWHLNTVIHRQQHLTGHFNLFMELPLPLQKIKGLH